MRISILEGVRDHIVPHIYIRVPVIPGSFLLKEKVSSIQMSKDEPIATSLLRFTQVQDVFVGVVVALLDHDLVGLVLLGLHKSWYGFEVVINGRENFPSRERLWTEDIQEEIWRVIRD